MPTRRLKIPQLYFACFMKNPLERFTSRVGNYVKYRPGYPRQIVDLLRSECLLSDESVIADIGSGTGILSPQ